MTLFQNSEISHVCDDGPYYPPERARFFRSCKQKHKKTPRTSSPSFFPDKQRASRDPNSPVFSAPTPPTHQRPLQPPLPTPDCERGADREPPEIERSSWAGLENAVAYTVIIYIYMLVYVYEKCMYF